MGPHSNQHSTNGICVSRLVAGVQKDNENQRRLVIRGIPIAFFSLSVLYFEALNFLGAQQQLKFSEVLAPTCLIIRG